MGKSIFTQEDEQDIMITADAFREYHKKNIEDCDAALYFIIITAYGLDKLAYHDPVALALYNTLTLRLEELENGKRK